MLLKHISVSCCTAQEALDQIEEKGYAEPYVSDARILYKVGVSFSSEKRNIDGWTVRQAV